MCVVTPHMINNLNMWNNNDNQRIYDRYINDNTSDEVVFEAGCIYNPNIYTSKTIFVVIPLNIVRRYIYDKPKIIRSICNRLTEKYLKTHTRWKKSSDFDEILWHRDIFNMIVSTDKQYYLQFNDYVVIDYSGTTSHQREFEF